MKTLKVIVAAAILITLGATFVDAAAKKIRKEAEFNQLVVGKTLNYPDGTFIKVTNGKLSGKAGNGQKITGAWNWQGRFFCRNVVVGKNPVNEDCQRVENDGDTVTFIRNKGRGKRAPATLN